MSPSIEDNVPSVDDPQLTPTEAVAEVPDGRPQSAADLKTAAIDLRFPSTNQARHCYTRYNEFYKCKALKGDDNEECLPYKKAFMSLCPNDWVERWEESREEGTWPGKY